MLRIMLLFFLFASIGASCRVQADGKIIRLTGGNAGQGFNPLPVDAGSIHVGGGDVTVQDITFAADAGGGDLPGGTFSADSITPASLGFGDKPTEDDIHLASLLRSFRYVNRAPFDFSSSANSAQYHFVKLNPQASYQLDLFTVADKDPRKTNLQVTGTILLQDTVLTGLTPQIIQYTLKPDASGTIVVRFGFGGGSGEAGLLSAIAITTDSAAQIPTASVDPKIKAITVTTTRNTIRLQPWSAGTIRVEAAPGTSLPEKKSFAVISRPDASGWTVTEKEGSFELSGPRMKASIDKKNGLVSFSTTDGKPLLAQRDWHFKPAQNATRDGLQIQTSFVRQPNEHFFGGGVIGDNFRQPQTEILLQNDYLQMHIPILYSSEGYGFFWDNPSRGKLQTTPDSVTWQASAGDLADFYVMAGPQADAVVGEYRHLTGDAPLFPKWAYGFWFSRDRFTSQQQILDAAQKFREQQIPIDLLVQDYYYWKPDNGKDNGVNWGSHHFDPVRYPNVQEMISQLHDQDHIHFMAVIWAKFDPATAHYQELDKAGGLFPPHNDWASPRLRYYDPYNPEARKIYGRQVMESLLPLGQDAFWMDGAEPEMDMNTFASFDTAAGPASRVMDAFPLLHTTSIYQAQRAATSDKRVVLLPRSSWAGEQRNSASSWSSDIRQDWKTLAWQIEGLQNYSICGLPYITTDIGGYNPTPEADRELFVRWFEWGSFCPIFRVHGVDRPFPWEYGTEGETILKKFDFLRYRLLPYIYSQASEITLDYGTLMRPLVFDFREDPQAIAQWDEFMFGPSILVCPVYQRIHEPVASPDDFADRDGKTGGVTATYIKSSGQSQAERKDLKDGLQFQEDATEDQRGQSSIRIEGTFEPKTSEPLAFQVNEPHAESHPVIASINGQAVPSDPLAGQWQFPLIPFQAQAGVPVHFSIETQMRNPVFQVVRVQSAPLQRHVYLPGKGDWYDFWTGERLAGSKTITVETPLDMIPLYIRAGSIIPMGPEIQYAAEQPDAPIELRIYRGADGAFTLYEDDGDNYDYEKGAFAKIPIRWDETHRRLTFGAREGSFPGMPTNHAFHIVWVRPDHGNGESVTVTPDTVISYQGKAISLNAVE